MSEQKIRMLYVDEVNNLVTFMANFRRQFELFTAASAREGMELLAKEEIHVIITDKRMPGIRGVAFLEWVVEKYPDVARILLTGYSAMEAVIVAINKTHEFK